MNDEALRQSGTLALGAADPSYALDERYGGQLDLVRWVPLRAFPDQRGQLCVAETGRELPFEVRRYYLIHDVTHDRGGHAHRYARQMISAVSGSCRIVLADGTRERSWVLEDPRRALLLAPMLFIRMTDFAPGTVLLVVANEAYDKSQSIRSWEEYLREVTP